MALLQRLVHFPGSFATSANNKQIVTDAYQRIFGDLDGSEVDNNMSTKRSSAYDTLPSTTEYEFLRQATLNPYSHSIVPGGLLVTS